MLLRFARSALVTLSILLVAAETNADGSTQTRAGGLQVGRPASVPVDPAPDAGVPDEEIRSDALAVFDSPPQEAMRLGAPATSQIAVDRPREAGSAAAVDSSTHEIMRVVAATAVVLVLLGLTSVGLRRLGGPLAGSRRPSGVLEVLARYPVARAQQLVLLKLGRRIVLLHQSKTAMMTLSELTDPDEVAAMLGRVEAGDDGGQRKFQGLLQRLMANGRAQAAEFPPTAAATGDNVVIDLTRRSHRFRRPQRRESA